MGSRLERVPILRPQIRTNVISYISYIVHSFTKATQDVMSQRQVALTKGEIILIFMKRTHGSLFGHNAIVIGAVVESNGKESLSSSTHSNTHTESVNMHNIPMKY